MIPPMIAEAAEANGWDARERGRFWFVITRGDQTVEGARSLYRHTHARAYRGNALSAIFRTQAAIARFLKESP